MFYLLLLAVALSPYLVAENAMFLKLTGAFWEQFKQFSIAAAILNSAGSAWSKLVNSLESTMSPALFTLRYPLPSRIPSA